MLHWTNILALIGVAVVVVVLLLGLANLVRGGDGQTSQKLMRWRVGLQFGAILLLLAILALRHL